MWCGSIFILCSSEGIRQVFGIFYKNACSCHFMCRVQNWPFSALRLERFWQLLKHAENWQLDWFDPSCLLALNKESQKQSAPRHPPRFFFSCWISLHFSSLRLPFAKWQHFAETLCPSWRSASSLILRLSRKSAERFEFIGDRGSRYQQVNRLRYKQTIWKMAVEQLLPVRTNKIFKQNGAFNNKPPSKILRWLVPLYHFGIYFSASVTPSLRALAVWSIFYL